MARLASDFMRLLTVQDALKPFWLNNQDRVFVANPESAGITQGKS